MCVINYLFIIENYVKIFISNTNKRLIYANNIK